MTPAITKVRGDISKLFAGYIQRDRAMQGFLNKNVVEFYRNVQRKRWITENQSEGRAWERLNPKYAERKRKVWRDAPGGGSKMLIASGALQESVIGPGKGFYKVATPRQLIIQTGVKYAQYVDEVRTFTEFSNTTRKELGSMIAKFLFFNEIRTYTK